MLCGLGGDTLQRTMYRGAVRDGAAEDERDARMLALYERGVPNSVIAQRMGVTIASVRSRVKRARHNRERCVGREGPASSAQPIEDAS